MLYIFILEKMFVLYMLNIFFYDCIYFKDCKYSKLRIIYILHKYIYLYVTFDTYYLNDTNMCVYIYTYYL